MNLVFFFSNIHPKTIRPLSFLTFKSFFTPSFGQFFLLHVDCWLFSLPIPDSLEARAIYHWLQLKNHGAGHCKDARRETPPLTRPRINTPCRKKADIGFISSRHKGLGWWLWSLRLLLRPDPTYTVCRQGVNLKFMMWHKYPHRYTLLQIIYTLSVQPAESLKSSKYQANAFQLLKKNPCKLCIIRWQC